MGGKSSKVAFSTEHDIPDLQGKVIIVTGGNGGIGYATTRFLAQHGAKVYIASRNESKCTAAISQLEREGVIGKEGKHGEVRFLQLDLVDPRGAKKSAENFMQMENRLDVLVNNAAALYDYGKPSYNSDGIINSMATNHLGPHVFTRTLLPLLKSTAKQPDADVRIVTVGSEAHKFHKTGNFKTKKDWNSSFSSKFVSPMQRYSFSKVATHLNMNAFVNRLDKEDVSADDKITVMIVDPGAVMSDGAKSAIRSKLPFPALFIKLAGLYLVDPKVGAQSSVFAATAPVVKKERNKYHGAYILPGIKIKDQSDLVLNKEKQEELWNCTDEMLKEWDIKLE